MFLLGQITRKLRILKFSPAQTSHLARQVQLIVDLNFNDESPCSAGNLLCILHWRVAALTGVFCYGVRTVPLNTQDFTLWNVGLYSLCSSVYCHVGFVSVRTDTSHWTEIQTEGPFACWSVRGQILCCLALLIRLTIVGAAIWRQGFVTVLWWPDCLLARPSHTLHSCNRYGVVAASLASEGPGSVTSLSKTFALLGEHG
jgi:hypothetical protein